MSKQDEILAAAQPLFSRYGLKKVTTDDIARDAHVSKATIYRYYGNKQEILRDVVRREIDSLLARIRQAVAAETTAENRLRAHLLTKITAVHELVNLHHVTADAMAENWRYAEELRSQFFRQETEILLEILNEGVASGELVVPHPAINAHFLVLAMQTLEYPWAIEGLDLTVPRQVDLMLRTLLDGLRTRREGA